MQRRLLNGNQPRFFHQIFFQSWPADIQPRTLIQSNQYNHDFANLTGCLCIENVTEYLRRKTADEILQASNAVKFDVLTYPDTLITAGLPWQATLELDSFRLEYNNIEFINQYASQITIPVNWGVNKDEGTLFIYEAIPQSVPILYPLAELIDTALWHPENFIQISILYNINALNLNIDYHDTIAQILGDYVFTCPMHNMSRALNLAGNTKIYSYIFDYILKANGTL